MSFSLDFHPLFSTALVITVATCVLFAVLLIPQKDPPLPFLKLLTRTIAGMLAFTAVIGFFTKSITATGMGLGFLGAGVIFDLYYIGVAVYDIIDKELATKEEPPPPPDTSIEDKIDELLKKNKR